MASGQPLVWTWRCSCEHGVVLVRAVSTRKPSLWSALVACGLVASTSAVRSADPQPLVRPVRLSRWEYHRRVMGVDFQVVLYGASRDAANSAAAAALDRVTQIDRTCSDYRPDSELRKTFDHARAGQPQKLSPDLARVLAISQRISRDTGGAFDVTVGPLTKLWRRARRQKRLPPADRLREARSRVGFRLLEVDERSRRATVLRDGMRLDLGGIAKGYAVDRAMEVLVRRGFTCALVDGSGDLRVGDPPPGRRGWRIEVESLKRPPGARLQKPEVVELSNVAVATSGHAYQSVTIDGRTYSHILDPRTGIGLTRASSVTVMAPDATTADALASAASVLGPRPGAKLVAAIQGVESLFVTLEGNLRTTYRSKGWPDRPAQR